MRKKLTILGMAVTALGSFNINTIYAANTNIFIVTQQESAAPQAVVVAPKHIPAHYPRAYFEHGHHHHHIKHPHWTSMAFGDIPADAVVGGYQYNGPAYNGRLYVCHGRYEEGVHPGKLIDGKCNIGYGGQEIVLPQSQVLTGQWYRWERSFNGEIPPRAVIGGYQQNSPGYNGPLYICRAPFRGGVHPGKLIAGMCNIGYGGREIALTSFEVLVR